MVFVNVSANCFFLSAVSFNTGFIDSDRLSVAPGSCLCRSAVKASARLTSPTVLKMQTTVKVNASSHVEIITVSLTHKDELVELF